MSDDQTSSSVYIPQPTKQILYQLQLGKPVIIYLLFLKPNPYNACKNLVLSPASPVTVSDYYSYTLPLNT